MSATRAELVELLDRVDAAPFGPAQSALARTALDQVRPLGDEDLEYQVRLRFINAIFHDSQGGDIDAMLSSFAWCLARYDADPQRFPAKVGYVDLLWQYKWMARALTKSPIFPSQQIDAVLDDMDRHYRRAGVGHSGVLMARLQAYARQGRVADAEQMRQALLTTPRDDYSHCDACTPAVNAEFLLDTDREAEGLELLDAMIASGARCGDEPAGALAVSLLPLLRAGRLAEARERHQRGYRISRGDRDHLAMIAEHVIFAVVTGNTSRALAMTERHLRWLSHDPLNVETRLHALQAFALALDAVTQAGQGETPIRTSDDDSLVPVFGEHDGRWNAAELAARAWQISAELSAQFDARNGNDWFARKQDQVASLASERYHLPLDEAVFIPVAQQGDDPVDGPGWLCRAIDHAWVDEPAKAAEAMGRAEPFGNLDPEMHAEALRQLASVLVRAGHPDGARLAITNRVMVLRGSGREVEADLEERLGLNLYSGSPDARAVLEAEVNAWPEPKAEMPPGTDRPELAARSTVRLAWADALVPDQVDDVTDPNELSRLVDQAVQQLTAIRADWREEPHSVWYLRATYALSRLPATPEDLVGFADELLALGVRGAQRASVLAGRASALGHVGRYPEAAEDADRATQLYLGFGETLGAASMAALAADLLEDTEPRQATQRLRYAISLAELSEADALDLRFRLGRLLCTHGDEDQAVDVLTDVVAHAETRDATWRGWALMWLGRALEAVNEFGSALASWNEATSLLRQGGDLLGAARGHRFQAQLLATMGQLEEARSHARLALETVSTSDDPDPQLMLDSLHLLGNLEAAEDPQAGLARLHEARDFAESHLGDGPQWRWQFADISDDQARLLASVGRIEDAIGHQLLAADLYAAADDANSAAVAETHAAGLLSEAGRPAEAVGILRGALAKATDPALRSGILLDLAATLQAVGEHGEAAEARAEAERQLAPNTAADTTGARQSRNGQGAS